MKTLEQATLDALRRYLMDLLLYAGGNRLRAAQVAECHRNTLTRLCAQCGIDKKYGRRKRLP